jgi:hypothetical protein
MTGSDANDQRFDIQAWLERAADDHMRTKARSALGEPLSAKLPTRVLQTGVTVVVIDDGMIGMVEFKAVGRDRKEFTTCRTV